MTEELITNHLPIVDKAWKVFPEDEDFEDYYDPEELEIVWAETSQEAKEKSFIFLSDDTEDISCNRYPLQDEVIFNGEKTSREYAEFKIKEEKKAEERRQFIESFPDDTMFKMDIRGSF